MDLGEVGLLLITRGEEEARRAIENYVRAADNATRSLEEGAQRAIRAEEAHERSIQRQIKAQMELVQVAASLRKSYEDTSASFSKMEKATLDYYRTEEMLKKGMEAGVVSATEYARVMELVQQRLIEVAGAIRVEDEEARIALQKRANDELSRAKDQYDAIVGSVDKVHAANVRLAQSQAKINEAYALGAINEQEHLHGLKMIQEQYDKDNPSERLRALDDEKRKQAEATAEKERLARAYDRLNASINPAIRGQQQFDAAMKTLNNSLAKEIISLDQYNRSVDDLRITLERSGHTVNQFGQVMSKSERDVAKFARGGMQQLGYQVGDFAVQVQGGTSVLVAFGQQGAQLAGIFGATGAVVGAVIAIVTSLAHAYLMANGEGKNLSDTISDMDSSFTKLNETLDELQANEFGTTFGDMSVEIKALTTSALALDSAMSLKNMIDTLDKLKSQYVEPGFFQEAASFMSAGFGAGGGMGIAPSAQSQVDASARQKEMLNQMSVENYDKLGFDMGYETFQNYQNGIDAAAKSGDMAEVTRQISAMFVDAAPDIESAQKIIASGGYDMLNAYRRLALAVAEANAKMVEYKKSQEKTPITAQTYDRTADEKLIATARKMEADEARAAYRSTNQDRLSDEKLIASVHKREIDEARAVYKATSQDRLSDEKLIATVRKRDADEVRAIHKATNQDRLSDEKLIATVRKRDADEVRAIHKATNQDRLSDERLIAATHKRDIEEARAAYKATNQDRYADEKLQQIALTKSLMDAYKAGKDLTKLDLPAGIDAAAVVAGELAKQLGISLESAKAIVGLGKGKGDQTIYDPRQPGYDPYKAEVGRTKAMMEGATYYVPPEPDKNKTESGGSKRDPMAELRAQLKLENEMLVLTKEQQRVYQALGEDRTKYSKTEIDSLAAEIKSIEDKKKAMEEMQSISDTIQSSMSDAFMSMVDGTATVEDAFKNMAREIIAQLYEVMVVQQIVGQWDAASKTGTGLVGGLMNLFKGFTGGVSGGSMRVTGQADGGAWMGGNQVTPYANGGLVMTPTMFGMSGGRRGIMGEAGPEAILPLSRASNGKLGVAVAGGGSNTISEPTNIHNNFNISGSDAETVRREIEKALPRISEVTKAAVLDSRRRGGKMMATF